MAGKEPCLGINLPVRGTVELKVLMVRGSQWDSPAFEGFIKGEIKIAGRLLGLSLNPSIETIDEPKAINGFGDGETEKGIYWFNKLGDGAKPTLIFTGKSGIWQAIVNGLEGKLSSTMAATFVTSTRGSILKNEGSVFLYNEKDLVGKTIAHEMGHLLGRINGPNNHSRDPSDIMYGKDPGCTFSEPWSSAVMNSRYVTPLTSTPHPSLNLNSGALK
ncbi:MAG: hypothetical protein ACXWQE_12195 [Bdellovibrionales bacterium]